MAKGLGGFTFTIIIIAALALIFIIPKINPQGTGIHGHITTINVAVYKDQLALQQLTEIDWGTLDPGDSTSVTFYLKSTSNVPITLTYQVSNWQPTTAETYMTVSWDYAGTLIQPGGVQAVAMTLHVSPAITSITDFAFDVTVRGAGGA